MIEAALERVETTFRSYPLFRSRVVYGGGSVVAFRGPTVLSERDLALQLVRALLDSGVTWDDIHLELALSKWLWADPHPAAALPPGWRVDLALTPREDLLQASLPATESSGFAFDAFIEVKYASDFWLHGRAYGEPAKKRGSVAADVEKCTRMLEAGACRSAWVVCFEECDHGFPADFTERAESAHPGLHVRLLRAWPT